MIKTNNDIINEYWKFGAEIGTQVENTSEKFDNFMNTIQHSESEVQELKNEICMLKNEIKSRISLETGNMLNQDLENYKNMLNSRAKDVENLTKQFFINENKINELNKKIISLEKENQELKKDINYWNIQSVKKDKEIEKLQKENQEYKQKVRDAIKKVLTGGYDYPVDGRCYEEYKRLLKELNLE